MITINTYKELEQYIQAFSKEQINLLIIKSRGGLGKTSTTTTTIPPNNNTFLVKGHATPLSIYIKILQEQPQLIIFDDVETLLHNKRNTSLLKQVCDTQPVKTVNYHTTHRIDGNLIPSSTKTTAKTLILCNTLNNGEEVKALLSRAIIINFKPSNEEILNKIAKFDKADKEIIKTLKNITNYTQINLRTYTKTLEIKKSGLDWKKYLIESNIQDQDTALYLRIEQEHPKTMVKKKAKLFSVMSGKSYRTYFNVKKRIGGKK